MRFIHITASNRHRRAALQGRNRVEETSHRLCPARSLGASFCHPPANLLRPRSAVRDRRNQWRTRKAIGNHPANRHKRDQLRCPSIQLHHPHRSHHGLWKITTRPGECTSRRRGHANLQRLTLSRHQRHRLRKRPIATGKPAPATSDTQRKHAVRNPATSQTEDTNRRNLPRTKTKKAPGSHQAPLNMGWTKGIEPSTTGITILRSTN